MFRVWLTWSSRRQNSRCSKTCKRRAWRNRQRVRDKFSAWVLESVFGCWMEITWIAQKQACLWNPWAFGALCPLAPCITLFPFLVRTNVWINSWFRYCSSSSVGSLYAAWRACDIPPSSSEAINPLACCISKMASSQKLTKASNFSLSPSVTIE